MNSKVLKVARGEIGVTEYPANSNKVKYNTWYYGREVSGSAYPWCMAFVQWCFAQTGTPLPYKTASCSALLNWYRQNKPALVVSTPEPGDIIIYNFGHTGILESAGGGSVTAIEGNTSAGSSGSQDNGGGVFRRTRGRSLVTALIRPAVEPKAEEISKPKEDDMMTGSEIIAALTDEQAYNLLVKAQRHAAALPEPAWSRQEGHWKRLVADGAINGGSPEGLIKRDELAAILGRKGLA